MSAVVETSPLPNDPIIEIPILSDAPSNTWFASGLPNSRLSFSCFSWQSNWDELRSQRSSKCTNWNVLAQIACQWSHLQHAKPFDRPVQSMVKRRWRLRSRYKSCNAQALTILQTNRNWLNMLPTSKVSYGWAHVVHLGGLSISSTLMYFVSLFISSPLWTQYKGGYSSPKIRHCLTMHLGQMCVQSLARCPQEWTPMMTMDSLPENGRLLGKEVDYRGSGEEVHRSSSNISWPEELRSDGVRHFTYFLLNCLGQCWVFAGVLVSATRSLGIPSRPITNFQSAHEPSSYGTLHLQFPPLRWIPENSFSLGPYRHTIDYFFDQRGQQRGSIGSIWNYHA